MAADKDTIYIDIDDEITGIIDKLKTSDSKVVALVLPKRAAVFQSIVNMKLLKRAADSDKKNLVLITSEAGLLPLAGAAGVHVAKTLNSKPEIPSGPQPIDDSEEAIEEDGEPIEDSGEPVDDSKPVGELAGAAAAGAAAGAIIDKDGVETLTLDDEDLPPELDKNPVPPKSFEPPTKGKKKGGKKNKKLAVPNFERFRLWLILGGIALVLLIIGFVFANKSLAKATITVKTDSTVVDVSVDMNLSTTAKQLSTSTNTVPAKLVSQQKTYTQQVVTTGQKNNGNKASGTIKLTNCSKQDGDITIPAGSSFSSGGNTFISQESVSLPESKFNSSGSKCNSSPSESVSVLAQNAGTAFNGATSFTAGSPYNGVTGTGNTSGGTDNIVKSVNQNDINSAKAKIAASNDATMKQTLKSQLQQEGYFAVESTYQASTPNVTTSATVGQVADNVTVTETVSYSMFGVHESDLEALVDEQVKDQIDTEKQAIRDRGIASGSYAANNLTATSATVTLTTKATAGPDINADSIRSDAAGKKPGEIKSDLGSNPDVTSVDVKLSPFWVSSVPKNEKHINVIIAKPTPTAKASSADDSNP